MRKKFRFCKRLFVVLMILLLFPYHSFAGDDYPFSDSICGNTDPWAFFYRNCTSYVAWRMNRDAGTPDSPYSFFNYMTGDNSERWGYAFHWADHARDLGREVNDIPVPGAIAHWGKCSSYPDGHVAYVESVNDDGTVNISEYNYKACKYGERSNIRASNYIHINTQPLTITSVGSPESGKVKISGGNGAFGSSKGALSVAAKFAEKQMSAVFDPQIISWSDTEIVLNLFTSGFNFDEFGFPVEISIWKSNGDSAGTLFYPFKDVRDYDWYAEYTTALWKDGVVNGEKEGETGNFLPAEEITRAEFIKMAVEASDINFHSIALPYTDIGEEHWAYSHVQAAYYAGWLDKSKTKFNPDLPINRAESAKILVSALGKDNETYTASPIYEDVSSTEWYYDDVHICTLAGIFQGYTPGKTCDGSDAANPDDRYFCPSKNLNRAEASKIIYKTFKNDVPAFLFGVSYEQFAPDRTIAPPELRLQGNSYIKDDQELTITADGDYCSTCTPSYEWAVVEGDIQVSNGQTKATWIPPQVSADRDFTIAVALSDGNGHKEVEYHQVTVSSAKVPCISVSGRITDSAGKGIGSVSMGGLPQTIWTNSNGEYSVCVGEGWSGTVIPSKTGYTFTPSSKIFSNVTSNKTQDFDGNGKTLNVSGRVTFNNEGLGGVVMNGLPGNPTTDENGDYQVQVPYSWADTVTPQKSGYSFSPSSRVYEEGGTHLRFDENYTALKQMHQISGRITFSGKGLEGVILNGLPGGVTDSEGYYSANVEHGWSGTVTPYKQQYVFEEKNYANVTSAISNEDYIAEKSSETAKIRIATNSQELGTACTQADDGDIVLVKPGIYENMDIDLDSNATLISEGGPSQTILKLSNDIQFGNSETNVSIDGFTIEYPGGDQGTMISIAGDSNIIIRNCKFIIPDSAYGIEVTRSDNVLIEGCSFDNSDNHSNVKGIKINACETGESITLRNNRFSNLYQAVRGKGNNYNVFIENNVFYNNEYGLDDLNDVTSLKITNNIFDGNEYGAELSYDTPHTAYFVNNTFANNNYGLFVTGPAILYNNIFYSSSTSGTNGSSNGLITIHHQMDWNSSSFAGSADYVLDKNTIWKNDPQFVSISSGDYHLKSYSPARGVGVNGVDLGAYGGTKGNAWKTPLTLPRTIPEMTSIEIKGPEQINRGQTAQYHAKGLFDGYYADINHVAQWNSSATSVLASQGKGSFLAVESGMATMTATYSGLQGQYGVTVLDSDLTVSLSDNMDPVTAGGEFQYIISYQNKGYGEAANVRISLEYDPNVIFLSSEPQTDAETINSWNLGNLPGGQSGTIAINVQASESLQEGSQVISNVTISSDFDEPVSIAEATKITGLSALHLSVTDNPDVVHPGDLLEYIISYENTGTGTAHNVRITENYDSNVTFSTASSSPDSGNNIWLIGDLAPGAKGIISVSVMVNSNLSSEATLKNKVTISADDLLPKEFNLLTVVENGVEKGDLDKNGEITPQDAIDAYYLSLKSSWTAEELQLADMNGDGEITPEDAIIIFELSL